MHSRRSARPLFAVGGRQFLLLCAQARLSFYAVWLHKVFGFIVDKMSGAETVLDSQETVLGTEEDFQASLGQNFRQLPDSQFDQDEWPHGTPNYSLYDGA